MLEWNQLKQEERFDKERWLYVQPAFDMYINCLVRQFNTPTHTPAHTHTHVSVRASYITSAFCYRC